MSRDWAMPFTLEVEGNREGGTNQRRWIKKCRRWRAKEEEEKYGTNDEMRREDAPGARSIVLNG